MERKEKSYILNFQFLTGLILFIIFIIIVFVSAFKVNNILSPESTPFVSPNFKEMFLGTDSLGRNVATISSKAIIYDITIILGSWFFCLIFSLLIGMFLSSKKWIISGIYELLCFGPPLIICGLLILIFKLKIFGIILAIGSGIIPYMIYNFAKSSPKKFTPMTFYYIVHSLVITSLLVILLDYIGFIKVTHVTLGTEFRNNLGFAYKHPYLLVPYILGSFFIMLCPVLMLFGVKNAHAYNLGLATSEEKEIIGSKDKVKEEKPVIVKKVEEKSAELKKPRVLEKSVETQTVEKQEKPKPPLIEKTSDEKQRDAMETVKEKKPSVELSTLLSQCLYIEDIYNAFTDYIVSELNYSYAILYHVLSEGYKIVSIAKKNIPSNKINLQQENDEFQSKAYKFSFLDTLRVKSNSFFVYPGKKGDDRVFHHLIVNSRVSYIIEVGFDSNVSNAEMHVNELRKVIPDAEWDLQRLSKPGSDDVIKAASAIPEIKLIELKEEPVAKKEAPEAVVDKIKSVEVKQEEIKEKEKPIEEISVAEKQPVEKESEDTSPIGKKFIDAKPKEFRPKEIQIKQQESQIDGQKAVYKEEFFKVKPYFEDEMKEKIDKAKDKTDDDVSLDIEVTAESAKPSDKDTGHIKSSHKESICEEELTFDFEDDLLSSRFDELINKGMWFIEKGEVNAALTIFKDTLAMNPQSHEAYMGLGHIYRLKNLYEDSIRCYKEAIRINKYSPSAYNYLGNIFYKTGNYKKALKAWQKALLIDPGRSAIRKNIENIKKIIDKNL